MVLFLSDRVQKSRPGCIGLVRAGVPGGADGALHDTETQRAGKHAG